MDSCSDGYMTDSDDSFCAQDSAIIFKWKCFLCDELAVNGEKLESQFLECTSITVIDDNGKRWIRCDNCSMSAHLDCLNRVTGLNITWEFLESRGRFTCC